MVVQKVYTASHHFSVTGEGYEPKGVFYCQNNDHIEAEIECNLKVMVIEALICL